MKTATKFAILLVVLTNCGFALAQNPLRATTGPIKQESSSPIEIQANQFTSAWPSNSTDVARQREMRTAYAPPTHHNAAAIPVGTAINPIHSNVEVSTVAFQEPLPDVPTSPALAMASDNFSNPDKILNLVMKISLNLVFVLSFAVGVMLIVKRWMQNNGSSPNSARASGDSLCIRETLRVDNRTTIRLVQWRSNRFLITSDHNGIQSVNALNDAFEQTLQELEDEPTDKQTLQRLLSGLAAE